MAQLHPEKPTAIFAMNDLLAGGVYEYAAGHGMKIGQDLSVIGFDNRDSSQEYRPPLSTVALPLFEMGRTAAQTLFSMIDSDSKPAPEHIIHVPCTFLDRSSVCAVK